MASESEGGAKAEKEGAKPAEAAKPKVESKPPAKAEAKAEAKPAAAKAPAKKAGAAHHESHFRRYMATFAALTVLTALELGVVYMHIAKSTTIVLLIALAVTKAGAVALIFMHLWDERPTLRRMVGLPLLFPPFYACVLIAEALFRSTFMP